MNKIALISPNKNVYSESFIQAHKKFLEGKIYYYYSGEIPTKLEGGIVINSRKKRIIDIFKGHYRLNAFSLLEQALITSFKKNKINLVFAEYGSAGQRIMPVCKVLDLPLIVHFHGFDASRKKILQTNNYYQELFTYATYIIVVSKKMHKDFLKLGCPKDKLIYNVYGPRKAFLEIKPTFKKQQFIAIGRFVDKKAPYYLILSFKEVIKEYPHATLVIAGNGELLNTCKNLVRQFNLKENIFFPGVITEKEYIGFLKDSLAMVQHSITADDGDTEGTPVAILEASAAGLPVIATHHAGIPDVVINKETGFLIKEHDISGMTLCMLDLLKYPERARAFGISGKKLIKENFTMERHIRVLNSLVKKILKKN